MAEMIGIEVAFATPERQELEALVVEAGATVADAIARSSVCSRFPGVDFAQLEVGVWGCIAGRTTVLRDGDRVEFYRPLARDPREARRELAQIQRLGSSS